MNSPSITIRPETPADFADVRRVNEAAFGRVDEADLVEALRDDGASILSLVGEHNDEVIGHILFCRIQIETPTGVLHATSLSPMAVLPEHQNRGIGSALVQRALEILRQQHESIITVLGHPEFYPRFGFRPAHKFNIVCPYEVPPEAWMLMELVPGVLKSRKGTVVYPRAFEKI